MWNAFELHLVQWIPRTYLNDVENNVLVETVQDALGHAVVIPGSVDEQ